MDFNVNGIVPVSANTPIATSSGSVSTNQSALPLINTQKQELLRKLGITQEQYDAIIAKNPDFVNLTFDKQQEFVETFKTENTVLVSSQSLESSQEGALVNNLPFDRLKFKDKETPIEDKLQTVAYELAKNQFMYGDPQNKKTEAQWAALTPEQQMELINATIAKVDELIKSKVEKSKIEEFKNAPDDQKNILISRLMTAIQTANSKGIDLDDFAKEELETREQYKYDYLSSVPKEELLFNERLFLNRNNLLKESVSHYLERNNLSQDNLSLDDLRNIIEQSDLTQIDIQYGYLLHKKENGEQLSKYETRQLEVLDQIYNSEVYKAGKNSDTEIPIVEECTISDLENTDMYSYADVSTKATIILKNINANCGENNEVAIEAELKRCFNYAIQNSDYELAQHIASMMNRQGIRVSEGDNSAMLASRVFTIGEADEEAAIALDDGFSKFSDQERAVVARRNIRFNAGEHQMVALSRVVTDNAEINNATYDMGTRAENLDIARTVYSNLYSYATQETKNYVAANADKAQADENVQNYVLDMYTKDNAEATQAAINAKVVTRFDKRNQTEAFSTLKTNAETLMPESDAINALNSLSDQIQYCDKDNQLAMHETIMGSRYSEVQTHAAGNIKNYDASVQSKAIDAVYNSGNKDAIRIVVNDISSFKSVDVQQLEAIRAIGEVLLAEGSNGVFLKGNLTYEQIKQLPASERREYIANYFKKLPIDEKIKLISQIKDVSMKKSIYVMIARCDSSLFSEICSDADRVDQLLGMGLPPDVTNKIEGKVRFYAVSDLQFEQVAEKYKIDIGNNTYFVDTEPKTANTFGYSSIPSGLGFDNQETSFLRKGIRFSLKA